MPELDLDAIDALLASAVGQDCDITQYDGADGPYYEFIAGKHLAAVFNQCGPIIAALTAALRRVLGVLHQADGVSSLIRYRENTGLTNQTVRDLDELIVELRATVRAIEGGAL